MKKPISSTYEPDFLDEAVRERAKSEPEVAEAWEAIKLVTELRAIRESKGLTQAVIAERMGIPQPHVARIEKRPWGTGFSRILAYAHAIGAEVTISDSESQPQAA